MMMNTNGNREVPQENNEMNIEKEKEMEIEKEQKMNVFGLFLKRI